MEESRALPNRRFKTRMTINIMLFLLVLLLWLAPQLYFLYCLEKRKPWAMDVARTLAQTERVTRGPQERARMERPQHKVSGHAWPPAYGRAEIWSNWL